MADNLPKYIKLLYLLRSKGKKTFSFRELYEISGGSDNITKRLIYVMNKKNLINKLSKNYYVILNESEIASQSVSPDSYIDQFMKYNNIGYYVGLLSAASFYGASHHRPAVYQVMVNSKIRPSKNYLKDLQFHSKKIFQSNCIVQKKGQYGYISYSSPALTAYDLVSFQNISGTFGNVYQVIQELASIINISDLKNLLKNKLQLSKAVRLGFVFEHIDYLKAAALIHDLCHFSSNFTPLSTLDALDGIYNEKWKIIDNVEWKNIIDS